MTLQYVQEFRRWQNAPATEKDRIAIEIAMRRIQTGPDWAASADPLNTTTPNGKLLGDCTKADLDELIAWENALANAKVFLAKRGRGPKLME
jgi:hypothetical protein